MHTHSRRALASVIAATLALGALAGSASAATGDGSSTDLHVRKAGGGQTVTVDPGGGGESIIAVL